MGEREKVLKMEVCFHSSCALSSFLGSLYDLISGIYLERVGYPLLKKLTQLLLFFPL